MSIKVAINGFGRIGRLVFKAAQYDKDVDVVAINDLTDANTLAYLLKYDSVHGRYPENVHHDGEYLVAGDRKAKVMAERDPANLPWADFDVDVVVESTGVLEKDLRLKIILTRAQKKLSLLYPQKMKSITPSCWVLMMKISNLLIRSFQMLRAPQTVWPQSPRY